MPRETRKAGHSSYHPVLTHSECWGGSELRALKIHQGTALGYKLPEESSSEVQGDITHSRTFPTHSLVSRLSQECSPLPAMHPLKDTHAVPVCCGCVWLLCGEDVASSKVKSNFISRKFHVNALLSPCHLRPLRQGDTQNTLAPQCVDLVGPPSR